MKKPQKTAASAATIRTLDNAHLDRVSGGEAWDSRNNPSVVVTYKATKLSNGIGEAMH